MKQFKLNREQALELQITNDAFFYLLEEEEPLDEANLEEAQEILAMFPNGFIIDENWKAVEDSDLIEATFVPYVIDDVDYDEYIELTKAMQLQIKWVGSNQIKVWRYNSLTGARELYGEFEVFTNEYGHKCFQTGEIGKGSLFFMKHSKKKV